MEFRKVFFINIFWLYFWFFQATIITSNFVVEFHSFFLFVYIVNLAIAFLLINSNHDKIEKLYYKCWKSITDRVVKTTNNKQRERWKQLEKFRPKLKFAKSLFSGYVSLFTAFNIFLFANYYLPFLGNGYFLNLSIKSNTEIIKVSSLYLFFIFAFFYLYELFITSYIKKILAEVG